MSESEWVSLRRAADILGVHPATVRNWADEGKLPSRRTPGGHRRFRRSDLLQYAEAQHDLQPLEVQVIIQNALGHARLNVGGGTLADVPWYNALSEKTRGQLRQQGLQTMEAIRKYLASDSQQAQLDDAHDLGLSYASVLHADSISLLQAVHGFFYFSDFIIDSILTWSEITPQRNSPSEWGALLRQVSTFTNAMLLAIIEYYAPEKA
jgi:excisionase family DNA binding protein